LFPFCIPFVECWRVVPSPQEQNRALKGLEELNILHLFFSACFILFFGIQETPRAVYPQHPHAPLLMPLLIPSAQLTIAKEQRKGGIISWHTNRNQCHTVESCL